MFPTMSAPGASSNDIDSGPMVSRAGNIADRSPVNIAPVGVNFGAIFEPMNAGSPANGGMGAELIGRYFSTGRNGESPLDIGGGFSTQTVVMIIAGLGVVFVAMRFKK